MPWRRSSYELCRHQALRVIAHEGARECVAAIIEDILPVFLDEHSAALSHINEVDIHFGKSRTREYTKRPSAKEKTRSMVDLQWFAGLHSAGVGEVAFGELWVELLAQGRIHKAL
jgi:hypothetical protein